jgi:hypothetical protein
VNHAAANTEPDVDSNGNAVSYTNSNGTSTLEFLNCYNKIGQDADDNASVTSEVSAAESFQSTEGFESDAANSVASQSFGSLQKRRQISTQI